ncbi:hypothetical protein HWV62_219 [Athelia sp. TMB]|nr:hypothetical protein HWV62_219 [Athelia sp. TMB]
MARKTSSPLSLKLFHTSNMGSHKTSPICASEIELGDLLERCQQGQEIKLDLHDVKLKRQGCISVRLSLAQDGSLIASNGQQLALELLRGGDAAVGRYVDRVFSVSFQVPSAVVAQPIADVLNKISLFMRIADDAAKVHPYAKLAWDVISVAHKIIVAQIAIDQSIAGLADTMRNVYSFVDAIEAVPKKIELLEDIIQRIFNQTAQCGMFIQEYTGHGFGGRVLREAMGASTPAKVASMADSLTNLRAEFDTGVAIQIATVAFRTHEVVITLCVLKQCVVENQTLELLASFGASLARSDLVGRPVCVSGTRRGVIDETHKWVMHPSERGSNNVLWLYGAAGTGKTAVATTVATHFYELQRLGAFMGFDRALLGKSQPPAVVLALAHQLALFDGRIAASIVSAINQDKRILTASLLEQFDALVVKPLASIPALHGEGPIVVVLDALDECGQPGDRAGLIEIFVGKTKQLPSNLRIIITSRPVDDIRGAFTMSTTFTRSRGLDLEIEANHSDIKAYFESRMQDIQRKSKYLAETWPGAAAVTELTRRAGGFFVWAVVASKFIDMHNPPKRLEELLLKKDCDIPGIYIPLDKFYTAALESAGDWTDEDFVSDFRVIMGTIISLPIPVSPEALDRELDNAPSRTLLRPSAVTRPHLSSFLRERPAVRILHPSFLDFLVTHDREIWRFDPGPAGNGIVPAAQCLQIMNAELKRNICNTSLAIRPDTAELGEELASACYSWVGHVCATAEHQFWVMKELEVFVLAHLVHWFEAMSIIRKVGEILPMLKCIAAWLAKNDLKDTILNSLVIDAIKLGHDFAADITEHPLHIYYVALLAHPTDSIVCQNFFSEPLFPDRRAQECLQRMSINLKRNLCDMAISAPLDAESLPERLAWACQSWANHVFAIAEHQAGVVVALDLFLRKHLLHWFEAMSIMKKTEHIVPILERTAAWLSEHGTEDKSLEMLVLDAAKFARNFAADIAEHPLYIYYTALPLLPPDSLLFQTFHDSRVDPSVLVLPDHRNIAYSSDGRRYAAWNAIERHSDIVVKETATGQELLKIANNGKLRYVFSVAFSYDGSRIAAAGSSSGVYVWDSVAGAEVIGPLNHSRSSDRVFAVAWSPNGERLVSASHEGEMILWDTASAAGNRLSTTRLPDSLWIVSAAFSSDGSQIAGCSPHQRFFVWDPLGGGIVWSVPTPRWPDPQVSFSSNDTGEFLLVKWGRGAQACDLSTGAFLPFPDSLADAVGLSRGGFMVDLLHRRIRKNMRWQDETYFEWGTHGEYFAFRTDGERVAGKWRERHHVFLLPKGVV